VSERGRILAWDGCVNVRDLGGLPLVNGGRSRMGAVVRADSLHELTPAGRRALAEHGVTKVIDLRHDDERADGRVASAPKRVVWISLLGQRGSPALREAAAAAQSEATDDDALGRYYVEVLERFAPNFAAVVDELPGDGGGVVVHCAGGMDRTGLVAALLLDLAGVEREAIAGDYALSERHLRRRALEWAAAAPDDAERERRRRISRAPAAVMLRVLEVLHGRHGGAAGYLRAAGVSDRQLARVRACLA
jgi:hypothetical protein